MPLIDIGDARLWTEIKGEGPPVLLVPGLGGRSTASKITYSVPQIAGDVLKLMDALGIEKAHLVGHSTGGAAGQTIALEHPERIDRMVISGSWAGPDPLFIQLFETRREILQKCGPAAYLTVGTLLAQPGAWLQARFTDAQSFLEDRLKEFPGLVIELSRIAAVMAHDLRDRVSAITVPTCVIGAKDDAITPFGFQEELARLIKGAELVGLDMGGHFAPICNAGAYNSAVIAFLTRG